MIPMNERVLGCPANVAGSSQVSIHFELAAGAFQDAVASAGGSQESGLEHAVMMDRTQ